MLVTWNQEKTVEQPAVNNRAILPPNQPNQVLPNPARPKPIYNKPDSIVIEKIGLEAPLVFVTGTSQKELDSALNRGVIVYPGSKMPDENGDFFLSGHSSTYSWNKTKYGQVFAALDRLEAGDLVIIYYGTHKYNYKVTKKYITTPDKVAVSAETSQKMITLYTCWPVGTSLKRLIVEGVQI